MNKRAMRALAPHLGLIGRSAQGRANIRDGIVVALRPVPGISLRAHRPAVRANAKLIGTMLQRIAHKRGITVDAVKTGLGATP